MVCCLGSAADVVADCEYGGYEDEQDGPSDDVFVS